MYLVNTIQNAAEGGALLFKNQNRKIKDWFQKAKDKIKPEFELKMRFFVRYLNTLLPVGFEAHKRQRNLVTNLIGYTKRNYIEAQFENFHTLLGRAPRQVFKSLWHF